MVNVIVLVSGQSQRMGKEKALLPFFESKSFINHIIDSYLSCNVSKIIVVVNQNNRDLILKEIGRRILNVTLVVNTRTEEGRLSSILAGLTKIDNDFGVFIQNIDNPFVNVQLIKGILKKYDSNAFVVPQYQGKNGHPLLLGASLVLKLRNESIVKTDFKSFLNQHRKKYFKSKEEGISANINDTSEYEKWFAK